MEYGKLTTIREYCRKKYNCSFFDLCEGDVEYIYFRYLNAPAHRPMLEGLDLALSVGEGDVKEVYRDEDGNVKYMDASNGMSLLDEVYVYEDDTFKCSQIKIGGE